MHPTTLNIFGGWNSEAITLTPRSRTLAGNLHPHQQTHQQTQRTGRVSSGEGSFPNPFNRITSSAEPSSWPQPLYPIASEVLVFPKQNHHSYQRYPSTLPIASNRHLIIASFVCNLVFILCVFSFSLPEIFSFS